MGVSNVRILRHSDGCLYCKQTLIDQDELHGGSQGQIDYVDALADGQALASRWWRIPLAQEVVWHVVRLRQQRRRREREGEVVQLWNHHSVHSAHRCNTSNSTFYQITLCLTASLV